MTDDLLDSLDAVESLWIDQVHKVVIAAVEQKVIDMISSVGTLSAILNMSRPSVPIQPKEEIADVFIIATPR